MKLKLTIKIFLSLNALVFSLLFHSQEFLYSNPEDEGFSKERLERIAPVIQNYIDEDLTPGVLTVIMRNEKIVYFGILSSMCLIFPLLIILKYTNTFGEIGWGYSIIISLLLSGYIWFGSTIGALIKFWTTRD